MKRVTFGFNIMKSVELPDEIDLNAMNLDELISYAPDFIADDCNIDYIQLHDDESGEEIDFVL